MTKQIKQFFFRRSNWYKRLREWYEKPMFAGVDHAYESGSCRVKWKVDDEGVFF